MVLVLPARLQGGEWVRWALGSVHSRVFSCSDDSDVLLVPFGNVTGFSVSSV